jgi:hypothetical protein
MERAVLYRIDYVNDCWTEKVYTQDERLARWAVALIEAAPDMCLLEVTPYWADTKEPVYENEFVTFMAEAFEGKHNGEIHDAHRH